MEREELISKISEKVGRTNVTEQTIGNFVDKFPLAEGTEPTEEYLANVADYFKTTVSGNISLEAANAVKPLNEQIAALKEQIAKMQGTPPTPSKDTEIQQMMQTLNELKTANEELKNQFSSIMTKQTQQQMMEQVVAKMKEGKATDEYVLKNTLLKHGTIDTKKSVDELVKDLLKEYDTEFTACRGVGAVPRTTLKGGAVGDSEVVKRAREEYKQRLIRAGKLPKPQV
jgi:regulator of replication initiation timing